MADPVLAIKFLAEELSQVDPTFVETIHREYWAANGEVVPSIGDLRLGAKKLISGRINTVGKATIYDGKATDIQLADYGISATEIPAVIVILSTRWNLFDLAAAAEAGLNAVLPDRDLVSLKMEALNRGINERLHEIIAFGAPNYGMEGVLGSTIVEIVNETQDIYTFTTDALYDWVKKVSRNYRKRSLLTAGETVWYVPVDLADRLRGRFTTNNDGNPYEMLTDPRKGATIKEINELLELSSSYLETYGVQPVGTNKDRILIVERDPRTLRRKFFPMDRTEPQLGDDGITYQVTGYAATTSVEFRQPFRAQYIDIPKYNNQAIAA